MNDFDITDIEGAVADIIRGLGVSEHVWQNRPKAVDDGIDDFVVVKVSGGVSDKTAFGQCRVAVYLYVRDVMEMKNKDRLSYMEKAFSGGMPLRFDRYIVDKNIRRVGDSADDFGFHMRILSFSVIIKIA